MKKTLKFRLGMITQEFFPPSFFEHIPDVIEDVNDTVWYLFDHCLAIV